MAFKKFSKKPKAFKKRVVKPSRALVKTIQQVIHRDVESKQSYHSQALTSYNPDINGGDIMRVIPNIGQGVDDNQRVGSQITAQSWSIKGHMILSTSNINLTNVRVAVRLIIAQPKMVSNWNAFGTVAVNYAAGLLKKGNVAVPFSGTIADLYAPIDRDSSIVYYDKIHYLSLPLLLNPSVTTTLVASDIRQTVKFFNFTKTIKKVLRFNDAIDGLQSQNFNPVLMMGYTTLDSVPTAPNLTLTQVAIAFDSFINYEDA